LIELPALGLVTHRPAQILGIAACTLAVEQTADIGDLTQQNMHSLGHDSPFLGWEFRGKVTYTID